MVKNFKRKSLQLSAIMTIGLVSGVENANAAAGGGRDFSAIAENITTSIASVPGLLTGVSYMMGILLGVLGILKIKDHVENPTQAHLKDGAIRLAAGGGLFALPIVYEAMMTTINAGDNGGGVTAAPVNAVEFNVN